MKQLLENVQYANERGVLNVVKLSKHEDGNVSEGTSFALGAFNTLQRLIDSRRDLFTATVIRELNPLSHDNDARVSSAAKEALKKL